MRTWTGRLPPTHGRLSRRTYDFEGRYLKFSPSLLPFVTHWAVATKGLALGKEEKSIISQLKDACETAPSTLEVKWFASVVISDKLFL